VAELQLEGDELVLHLSGAEKAEAVRGDLRAPLPAMRGVEVLRRSRGRRRHLYPGELSRRARLIGG
jgi:hypothetical protein